MANDPEPLTIKAAQSQLICVPFPGVPYWAKAGFSDTGNGWESSWAGTSIDYAQQWGLWLPVEGLVKGATWSSPYNYNWIEKSSRVSVGAFKTIATGLDPIRNAMFSQFVEPAAAQALEFRHNFLSTPSLANSTTSWYTRRMTTRIYRYWQKIICWRRTTLTMCLIRTTKCSNRH